MSGMYKTDADKVCDQILTNTKKMFSADPNGKLVPASEYENTIHKELKSNAIAKLAIDKAMTDQNQRKYSMSVVDTILAGAVGASVAAILGSIVMHHLNKKYRLDDRKQSYRKAQFALNSLYNDIHSSYNGFFKDVVEKRKLGTELPAYTYSDLSNEFDVQDLELLLDSDLIRKSGKDFAAAYSLSGTIAQKYRLCLSLLAERNHRFEIYRNLPYHSPPTTEMREVAESINDITDLFLEMSVEFMSQALRLSKLLNRAYQLLVVDKPFNFESKGAEGVSLDEVLTSLEEAANI